MLTYKKEYPIIICGPDHIMSEDMWCRPLSFIYGNFGGASYTQKACFGGLINNYKWVPITDVLGPNWMGRPISDYMSGRSSTPMEFCKGELPPYSKSTKKQLLESEEE